MVNVVVYRSKPNTHQAPGGYWFIRVINMVDGRFVDTPTTPRNAQDHIAIGVRQIADGGGL